ncbi:FAD/NAD(P)-binding domain-containing protein [Leucogyrophana mollusca]|uniref:FAD/NAD(P)-binding domain-containing protein n=1 Tax=Leucogyrophana mollusca TaxID=85980 RepID=A0ACB8BPL6_9AGAM|nr:FAD/NAD(P)-binding domain-containing protein [Leucogyrophana mollusca]
MSTKNIVIIGAGFAGTAIANGLSAKLDPRKYNLILINPRSYGITMVAGARMVVSGEQKLEEISFVKLDKLFVNGNGETKVGVVTSIEKTPGGRGGAIVLASGERVTYEVLVLASGSAWDRPLNFPAAEADVIPHITAWRNKFANATNVVLVGGGAVGIELAGELRDSYPNQKVTIVQGDKQLLNSTYSSSFRDGMTKRLRARGVEIVFDDFVDDIPPEGSLGVTTRRGKRIEKADLVLYTRGPRPNTDFINSLGSDSLNGRGYVKVKPTLQLLAHPDIFAAGDIIEWKEQKQAAKTHGHASVVVANVLAYLSGKPVTKPYKGSFEMMVITNGKSGGMAYFPFFGGFTLGDWFARLIKSKTLLVPMWRKALGYTG